MDKARPQYLESLEADGVVNAAIAAVVPCGILKRKMSFSTY